MASGVFGTDSSSGLAGRESRRDVLRDTDSLGGCPYVECNGLHDSKPLPSAHCSVCHRPLKFCTAPGCGAANRTLGRYCRLCGRELPAAAGETALVEMPTRIEEPLLIRSDEQVWYRPLVFAEYIWYISDGGGLFRASVSENQISAVKMVGSGFGRSAPILTRNLGSACTPDSIVLNDETSVKLIDLDSGAEQVLYQSSDRIVLSADPEDAYSTVAQDSDHYYVSGRQDGRSVLVRIPRRGGQPAVYVLPEAEAVVGPVITGGVAMAFSGEYVYWLQNERIAYKLWPAEFRVCHGQREAMSLVVRPAFGQMPFAVSRHGTYVIGQQRGAPAFGIVTGFEAEPSLTTIAMDKQPALLSQVLDSPPLVVRHGGLFTFEGTQRRVICPDELWRIDSAPFHLGNHAIARAEDGVGGRFVRIHTGDVTEDYSITDRKDYEEGMAFAVCSGKLVHMYCNAARKARFLIWQ